MWCTVSCLCTLTSRLGERRPLSSEEVELVELLRSFALVKNNDGSLGSIEGDSIFRSTSWTSEVPFSEDNELAELFRSFDSIKENLGSSGLTE